MEIMKKLIFFFIFKLSWNEKGVMSIVNWFVLNLFHPWFSAHYWCSYQLYTESDRYYNTEKNYGKQKCIEKWPPNMKEFMEMAIDKRWADIIFTPWRFNVHEDFLS